MTNPSKTIIDVDDRLYQYILGHGVREPEICRRLRERTAGHILGGMQMTPDQGELLAFLIKLTGTRRILEAGVFTGCSTLRMALELPETGYILACETREEFAEIGLPFWKEAGVDDKIELRIAPAEDTMRSQLGEGWAGTYDFIFIDADKQNYEIYYELSMKLVRPGGLICVDNVLWMGKVADPEDSRPTTHVIRRLNEKIASDSRADICMLPVADGMTLVRKR